MLRELVRFEPFCELSRDDLRTVARYAQLLTVPPGRWLVRPGRQPPGHYFLARGRVRVTLEGRHTVVNARSYRARYAIYPGPSAIISRSAIQLLLVDQRVLDFLGPEDASVPACVPAADDWAVTFLGRGVMRRLSSLDWQAVLRQLELRRFEEPGWVFRTGDRGQSLFIVQEGRARVERAGVVLAELGPGQFFGEDALITGALRGADVGMMTPGVLGELSAHDFERLVLRSTVRTVADPAGAVMLSVRSRRRVSRGAVHVPLPLLRERAAELDPDVCYVVEADSLRESALAAFLLTQRGFEARVLERDAVEPGDS